MLFLLYLAASFAVTLIGFIISHRFVESRLRYVDAVQRPYAPFLAGGIATVIALPVVGLLPFVGLLTALGFGFGVFAGVASGAREIRRRIGA
jgi:hypothetical protein